MEEISFASKEELYHRVMPALRAKLAEVHRLGYSYIQEADIWNFLIQSKWVQSSHLMLADIVSDILNVSVEEIDFYLKGKLAKEKRRASFHHHIENRLEV